MPSRSHSDGNSNGDTSANRGRSGKPTRASWRQGTAAGQPEHAVHEEQPHGPITDHQPTVSHKWRDMQQEHQPERELPPLPPDRKSSRNGMGGAGSKAIIFGAVLLAAVAAMLFLPFSPLVDHAPDPTPVATAGLPTPTERSAIVVAQPTEAGNISSPPQAGNFLVCIDPGHGGWDFGRERMDTSTFGPPYTFESELTLSMSLSLRDELLARGIDVVMTRETGGAVNWRNEDVNGDGQIYTDSEQGRIDGYRDEFQARINICNNAGADIMISVHLNGYDDQSVNGYQVYFNSQREFSDRNKDLAVFIYREMTVAFDEAGLDTSARGYTDDLNLAAETHEYGSEQFLIMIGPEVRKPEYTIVPTAMPGVIIETLFLTNSSDAAFIMNPDNQRLLAASWADGIENYGDRYGDGN